MPLNVATSRFLIPPDGVTIGINGSGQLEIIGLPELSQDLVFSDSANGPVIKDRSTGTSYRIKIDNNIIKIETLT